MAKLASILRAAAFSGAAASLAACASVTPEPAATTLPQTGGAKIGQPYTVNGRLYTPRQQPRYDQEGMASWYGDAFHMRTTASGEMFDMNAVSAAHTTLPLPSLVEVTNLDNGRRLVVRVNDRGPFVDDRIIDLSREAARELGFERQGLARVRVRYIGPAPLVGPDAGVRVASAKAPPRRSAPLYASRAPRASQVAFVSAPAPAAVRKLEILPSMPARSAASTFPGSSMGAYRIQAAAYAQQANAQRAVGRLVGVGPAVIEPIQRNGATLYRVMLNGPTDETQAFGLREKVAAAGFEDAKVVRP